MKLLIVMALVLSLTSPTATSTKPFSRPDTVYALCKQYKMDPRVISKQIMRESSGRWWVIGKAGEVGLMQVKPSTATDMLNYEVTSSMLKDSLFNVEVGLVYLIHLQKFFGALGYRAKDCAKMAWSAYNEGPKNTLSRHFKGKQLKQLLRAYRLYYTENILPKQLHKRPVAKPNKYAHAVL